MSFILGFDVGKNSIGVALYNTYSQSASLQKALVAKNFEFNIKEFENLISQWQPKFLVVGLPLNMDGSTQELTNQAIGFGRKIEKISKLKVYFQDERLTTVEAKEFIFEKYGFRRLKKNKGQIDSTAAAIILESFFSDSKNLELI